MKEKRGGREREGEGGRGRKEGGKVVERHKDTVQKGESDKEQ